jgi:hypothetical protein
VNGNLVIRTVALRWLRSQTGLRWVVCASVEGSIDAGGPVRFTGPLNRTCFLAPLG